MDACAKADAVMSIACSGLIITICVVAAPQISLFSINAVGHKPGSLQTPHVPCEAYLAHALTTQSGKPQPVAAPGHAWTPCRGQLNEGAREWTAEVTEAAPKTPAGHAPANVNPSCHSRPHPPAPSPHPALHPHLQNAQTQSPANGAHGDRRRRYTCS